MCETAKGSNVKIIDFGHVVCTSISLVHFYNRFAEGMQRAISLRCDGGPELVVAAEGGSTWQARNWLYLVNNDTVVFGLLCLAVRVAPSSSWGMRGHRDPYTFAYKTTHN